MKRIVLYSTLAVAGLCLAADGFAAERVINPVQKSGEIKTAGLFGLSFPCFGPSCSQSSSCGAGGCGYTPPCYGGNCSSSYRYPSYGYPSCGPNGCYSPTPMMTYPTAPVIYQQAPPAYTVPAPYTGYSNPGYMPYAPANYGVPYGARPVSKVTGYGYSTGANSPFYP